jgi:hypothetical protein
MRDAHRCAVGMSIYYPQAIPQEAKEIGLNQLCNLTLQYQGKIR